MLEIEIDLPPSAIVVCRNGHRTKMQKNNSFMTVADFDGVKVAETGQLCPVCVCNWLRENFGATEEPQP